MFKNLKFAVWPVFIICMVITLFSFNHARANSHSPKKVKAATVPAPAPAPVEDTAAEDKSNAEKIKSYAAFLCGQFQVVPQCKTSANKIIDDALKSNTIPKSMEELKSFVLDLSLKICNESTNVQGTWNVQRNHCFRAADQGLSGENSGNHPECHKAETSFIWKNTSREFSQDLTCYQKAFENDLALAKKVQTPVDPVDPAISAFMKLAVGICHKIYNVEPSDTLKAIPDEFRGLLMTYHGGCEKSEETWALNALKDDGTGEEKTATDLKYLKYDLIKNMCMDKVESQRPKFTEKCFYSFGLAQKGFSDAVNYTACLTPEIIPPGDKSEFAVANLAMAKGNVYQGLDAKSHDCYMNAFNADLALVTEVWKAEKAAEAQIQSFMTPPSGAKK